jgi:protein-tyrosine phosphatase
MIFSQVLPQLFVGSYPANIDDIDRLKKDCGITAILSLQTDENLDRCDVDWMRMDHRRAELGIKVRRIPVEAFDGQDGLRMLYRCVAVLDGLLRGGHAVYVHCNLGTVRSPSVVTAYLVWRQGWRLTDAVEYVRRCHPCSPDIAAIRLAEDDRKAAA